MASCVPGAYLIGDGLPVRRTAGPSVAGRGVSYNVNRGRRAPAEAGLKPSRNSHKTRPSSTAPRKARVPVDRPLLVTTGAARRGGRAITRRFGATVVGVVTTGVVTTGSGGVNE